MRCKACWREAQRIAKRGGAPDNRIRGVTKRIYLSHHIAVRPLSACDPTYAPGPNESELPTCKHIHPRGDRRHRNGKVILAPKNGS